MDYVDGIWDEVLPIRRSQETKKIAGEILMKGLENKTLERRNDDLGFI
jgi:hypothetical protein